MTLKNKIGGFFFKWRDKLPAPLVVSAAFCARPRPVLWLLGLPFILLGEALRLWALTHIGPKTRTRSICAENLVVSGPYRYCRNPLYLANSLKITGILLIAGNAKLAAAVIIFYTLEFITMISYEENFLTSQFEKVHQAYKEAVPAFWPTLCPNEAFKAKPKFSLAEAVKSEKSTFASTAAILAVLAVAPKIRKAKA